MAEIQKRRHFAREWLKHSVSETSKSTRNASLGLAAGVGVLTGLVNWIRSWHSGHPLSPWGLIWPGLAVAGIVLLALFLFHFFAAPFRMAGHVHKTHEADLVAERRAHQMAQLALEREKLSKSELESKIKARRAESVDIEHRDTIRRIAKSVAESIRMGQPCKYADPDSALIRTAFRTAIEVHCPSVIPPCDHWDDSLDEVRKSLDLVATMVDSKVDANFSEPWLPDWVKQVVRERLVRWAENPTDLSEFPVRLNHAMGAGDDYAYVAGFLVYYKLGLTSDEVSAAEATLNDFVQSLTESAEVKSLRVAYIARNNAREPAEVAALSVLDPYSLPRGDGCPLC